MGYDAKLVIGTEVDTKSFEAQISEIEDELEQISEEYEALEKAKPFEGKDEELRKMRVQAEKLNNKLGDLKDKQKDLENVNISNFGVSLEKLAKKVTHFGLALLGVGSVYGLVRKAARSYLAEHEETAQIFSSMWKNLMEQLEPYIEKVINWVLKLLGYLNVFLKTISGGKIDLTKKMKNNTKAIEKTSKATKELNNQMAQFDDATKLSDNRSLDVGVGNTDLDKLDELNKFDLNPKWVEKLEWLAKKIKDNWPTIKQMAIEIGTIFAVAKVGEWLLNIGKLLGYGGAAATGAGGAGLVGLAVGLLAIAAALGVLATAKTWQDVIDNYKKLRAELEGRGTEGESSKKVSEKVADALLNPQNYTPEQVGLAKSSNRSQIKSTTQEIKGHAQQLRDWTKGYRIVVAGGDAVISSLRGQTNAIDLEENELSRLSEKLLSQIDAQNKAIEAGNLSEQEIAEYVDWLKLQQKELYNSRNMLDSNSKAYRILDETISQVRKTIDTYQNATQAADNSWVRFSQNLGTNSTQIKNDIQAMTDKIIDWNNTPVQQKKFSITTDSASINEIINATSYATNVIGQNIAKSFGTAMTNLKFQMAFTQAANNISMGIQRVFGLASGGLINLPGRGVPLGQGVIGGERGTEGVLPLTDQAAMETLGETIGRYVTINANITNTMNGRVISRELQKINNENTFMNNR